MKRILVFSLAYYPKPVGGAEVAIKEITDRILPEEVEFHVVTAHFDTALPSVERMGNVVIHRVGFGARGASGADTHSVLFYFAKILFVPSATIALWRLHKTLHFDALWAMMSYMVFPIVLARLMGVRIPYVITLQEGDPFEYVFKRWYIRPFGGLLTFGFTRATIIQSISEYLKQWALGRGATCPIEVIPNGVNTKHFSHMYEEPELSEIKRVLGKQTGDTFLITTSRLVHKNAVDDVIRALALLPASVKFAILGTGPDESMIRTLAVVQGVTDRVHFLGQVEHTDMPKYLKACDIFIRPSRSEGMGNSFIEAMAAGMPVIATQEGGIADFLFDEKRNTDKPTTGWAVDRDNPADIAAAVQDILTRPEKVREVTATARAMVVARYDWNLVAREMHERVFGRL
jgi:glycosyltransferase involved in cell wall biosynthesis